MSIPKIIHYCWFGNGKKSELIKKCIASWKKYCPECEVIEWNESNYDVTKNVYMKQAYECKKWGFVSDYARLDIMYEYGGIYLDTDVEIIRNIDELFNGEGFFGFEKTTNKRDTIYYVNTGQGFGAKPKNELILKMKEQYEKLSFINEEGKMNLQTCPYYNTQVLEQYGLKKDNSKQMIGDMIVYPSEYFCPISWKSREKEIDIKTFSVHHFNTSWLSKKEKKKRKIKRNLDYALHLPNMFLVNVMGKQKYERLKEKVKR